MQKQMFFANLECLIADEYDAYKICVVASIKHEFLIVIGLACYLYPKIISSTSSRIQLANIFKWPFVCVRIRV